VVQSGTTWLNNDLQPQCLQRFQNFSNLTGVLALFKVGQKLHAQMTKFRLGFPPNLWLLLRSILIVW